MFAVSGEAAGEQPGPQSHGGIFFFQVLQNLILILIPCLNCSFKNELDIVVSFCSGELVQIMMATANENLSAKFCNRVLKFFTKLFQLSKSSKIVEY